MTTKGTLRICPNGHKYYKSTDCNSCPVCEQLKKPADGFLSLLSAPARRALSNNNIHTLKDLASYSERDLMKSHGFGRASLPVLRKALAEEGLSFTE